MGNCLEATEHRLAVLRRTPAGPLPGKSLVVYDASLAMVIDMFPCEDGHAQERALLGDVLLTVEAGDIWVWDRDFCVGLVLFCCPMTTFRARIHALTSWARADQSHELKG